MIRLCVLRDLCGESLGCESNFGLATMKHNPNREPPKSERRTRSQWPLLTQIATGATEPAPRR